MSEIPTERECRKCKIIKSLSDFVISKTCQQGRMFTCSKCNNERIAEWGRNNIEKVRASNRKSKKKNREKSNEYNRQWKKDNRDHVNEYKRKKYAEDPEKIKIQNKKSIDNNPGKVKERSRKYYLSHIDKFKEDGAKRYAENTEQIKASTAQWAKNNPDKTKIYSRRKQEKRMADPMKKLNRNMSFRVWTCLKTAKASRTWKDFVDFTSKELMEHLEQQFVLGMTWDNYGEWHVDHKIPLSSFIFQLPTDDEFKKAWALSNLQPMWGIENVKKGKKILYPELYKELTGR